MFHTFNLIVPCKACKSCEGVLCKFQSALSFIGLKEYPINKGEQLDP